MHRINIRPAIYILILWLITSTGCTGSFLQQAPPQNRNEVEGEHFLLVTATSRDSLESLAEAYYNDIAKAWRIAQYNQIETITAGQQLVIPLVPTAYGGLGSKGYQTVPILFYPRVAHKPTNIETVSSKKFHRHITYLRENDFKAISLNQLNGFLNLSDQLPPNAVMISFDSADRWVYNIAYPILKRYGMKAALFVPVEQIGQPDKLTWQQLAIMAVNGIDIGCHGPDIRSFNSKDVNRATRSIDQYISQAKEHIEQNLEQPCRDFSTPHNEINDLTTAILKKHGYRTGLTRKSGQNPFFVHNFNLRRSVIHGRSNLHQFGRNLITFQKAPLR